MESCSLLNTDKQIFLKPHATSIKGGKHWYKETHITLEIKHPPLRLVMCTFWLGRGENLFRRSHVKGTSMGIPRFGPTQSGSLSGIEFRNPTAIDTKFQLGIFRVPFDRSKEAARCECFQEIDSCPWWVVCLKILAHIIYLAASHLVLCEERINTAFSFSTESNGMSYIFSDNDR